METVWWITTPEPIGDPGQLGLTQRPADRPSDYPDSIGRQRRWTAWQCRLCVVELVRSAGESAAIDANAGSSRLFARQQLWPSVAHEQAGGSSKTTTSARTACATSNTRASRPIRSEQRLFAVFRASRIDGRRRRTRGSTHQPQVRHESRQIPVVVSSPQQRASRRDPVDSPCPDKIVNTNQIPDTEVLYRHRPALPTLRHLPIAARVRRRQQSCIAERRLRNDRAGTDRIWAATVGSVIYRSPDHSCT